MAQSGRTTLTKTMDGLPTSSQSNSTTSLPAFPGFPGRRPSSADGEPVIRQRTRIASRSTAALPPTVAPARPNRRPARQPGNLSEQGLHQAEDFFQSILLHTSTSNGPIDNRDNATRSPRIDSVSLRDSAIVSPPKQRDGEKKPPTHVAGFRSSTETLRSYVNNTTIPNAKIVFTTRGVPFGIVSVIKFQKEKKKNETSAQELTRLTKPVIPKQGVSYETALNSEWFVRVEDGGASFSQVYDPLFVDDPGLTTGKHRTVMNLPSFKVSVIPFVKASDLKSELNKQFRNKHPQLSSEMTLTKVRALKKKMLEACLDADTEISTVALAYVYFEKLLLKAVVTKINRKLIAATCLLLALKWNDQLALEVQSLKRCTEIISKGLGMQPKDVLDAEVTVLGYLNFSLFTPDAHLMPHYQRLAKEIQQGDESSNESSDTSR